MTFQEGIDYIRLLLDESGIEAYTDSDILGCIGEAQVAKAREYYYRGEKEAVRPLYREEVGGGTTLVLSEIPMNIEVCMLKTQAAQISYPVSAEYVEPLEYQRYQFPNPSVNTKISGRAEYTYDNNTVQHNGIGAMVCYYKLPIASGYAAQIELAEYCHPQIVDYAASMIFKTEVPDADHAPIGSLYDIEHILTSMTANNQ